MNKCMFIGRLTRDPEARYVQRQDGTSMCVAMYSLAVDRSGEGADFINVKAYEKQGEFAEKYLKKGMKIGLTSSCRTGSYTDKDGRKQYTTDFVAERQEFCEKKNDSAEEAAALTTDSDGFSPAEVEDLPFAQP